jgi:hypothetical protein
MTKTAEMEKLPNQNIDVQIWQTRTPNEWKARVQLSSKETFVIGPANIASILANVTNLVRIEANYADLYVHETKEPQIVVRLSADLPESVLEDFIIRKLATDPMTMRDLLKQYKRSDQSRVKMIVLDLVDRGVLDVGLDYLIRILYRYCPTCESNVPVHSTGDCAVAPAPICGGTYPFNPGKRIYIPK